MCLRGSSPQRHEGHKGTLAAALLLLFCLLPALAFAALSFPALTGRVVDEAHVIPEAARADVELKSKVLEDRSGIQLVVATVPSLQGADIETFANELFRHWRLGEAKKDNGVLFLIAPAERKMRIEVGYGLEGTLTDALSKVIIATAVAPKFKAGDFGAGVERGVDAIIEVLSGDAAEWQKRVKVRADGADEKTVDGVFFFIVFALFLVTIFQMLGTARGGRRAYRGGRGPVVYYPSSGGSSSWDSGSSWSSGGSSSGGGDSFSGGGGSSGGGGASGDW